MGYVMLVFSINIAGPACEKNNDKEKQISLVCKNATFYVPYLLI